MKIFITGTDTHVGKTTITCQLLSYFKQQGITCCAHKPIASGCEVNPEGELINADALALHQQQSICSSYKQVNPIAFLPAIAPHLASDQIKLLLTARQIQQALKPCWQNHAEITLIEGAGGWHCPLNRQETYADLVQQQSWPVILVVGIRLGCLNHALLSARAIQSAGVQLLGWIANHIDPNCAYPQDNIDTLVDMIDAPLLAELPYHGLLRLTSHFHQRVKLQKLPIN